MGYVGSVPTGHDCCPAQTADLHSSRLRSCSTAGSHLGLRKLHTNRKKAIGEW